MKYTIIFDMYGVILLERTGNFLSYVFDHFEKEHHPLINRIIYEDKLFTKAGYGYITSHDFLSALGFEDPEYHMRKYIENYLTLDPGFISFAEKYYKEYDFVLLSTDVSEWSKYITKHYKLDKYFKYKIVSGDVHLRKPDREIYELTLETIRKNADECCFVDNNIANLNSAEEVGITPILFNRDNDEYDKATVYSFEELDELFRNI